MPPQEKPVFEERFPLPITRQTVEDVKPFMLRAAAVGMRVLSRVEDNQLVLAAVTIEEIAERMVKDANLFGGIEAITDENGITRFIPRSKGRPTH